VGPQARADVRQEDVAEVEIEDVDDGGDITIRDDTIAEENRNDHAVTSQIRSEVRGAKQTRDSQPKSRIPAPSRRIPVGQRWAYVPVEQGGPVDTFEGPRSKTGRPIRQPNRFAGLTSKMASEGEGTAQEPKTVCEALSGRDGDEWLPSMESEIKNIESMGTWIETSLPEGRKAVSCKWVSKVKADADGKVVKYKSRLVAQGFSQLPGVDYEETFALVGPTT
jgi:hypothetical protein